MSSVAVIGAGAWGTALAIQAARAGNSVTLWARDQTRAATIAASRENPHLPGMDLPEPIAVSSALPDIADLALLAVPTQHLRAVVGRLPPLLAPLVVCVKGVEQATLRLPLEIVAEVRPGLASRRSHRARTLPTRSQPDCRPPPSSRPPTPGCAKPSPRPSAHLLSGCMATTTRSAPRSAERRRT